MLHIDTPLDSTLIVYVPGTINKNEPSNNSESVLATKRTMCRIYGGATSLDCNGMYEIQNEDEDCHCYKGDLIEEKITKIYSKCTYDELIKHLPEFYDMCRELKTTLNQESIAIEINGRMGFV